MPYGTVNAEQMTTQSGFTLGAGNASSFKNRVINGGMTIDQRNAGASVTINPSAYTLYGVDRFIWNTDTQFDNTGTSQQVTTAPAGFNNSLKATVTSTVSPTGTNINTLEHRFEGYNVADLGFGTANAKTVTVSFWVNCSVTGNFGGALVNNARNRTYPFTYTVSSANTWEQKTVTIPGDTSGTWPTTNGRSIILIFGLSAGSTYGSGTAGAWSSTYSVVPTGSTNLWATNGATWYLTGVQVEVGTVATSFDFRSYTTELQLCQRYYYLYLTGANSTNGISSSVCTGAGILANYMQGAISFPTTMRTFPTLVSSTGTNYYQLYSGSSASFNSISGQQFHPNGCTLLNSSVTISSGAAAIVYTNNASASIALNAEL